MTSRATPRFWAAHQITLGYRAIGVLEGDDMTWFWIGSHADYDRLLRRQ